MLWLNLEYDPVACEKTEIFLHSKLDKRLESISFNQLNSPPNKLMQLFDKVMR